VLISLTAALASGTRANVNSVIFRFDGNDVLSDYERTVESSMAEQQTARAETSSAAQNNPAAAAAPANPAKPARTTPPRPARQDSLPDWLPSSSTKDPRDL
jgi:pyruvate/2-oxoglutarate dehydrogenase complex dihydrolipoamide acyltransferase (E2) component